MASSPHLTPSASTNDRFHHHARPCPATTRKDIYDIDPQLYESHSKWLKSRGRGIRPHLTNEQKQELETVFHLMDEDGSGSIDTEELGAAFRLLGFKMSKSEIQSLVDEVDHDHTGELEWTEFIEIFLETLRRVAEEKRDEEEAGESGAQSSQVPLALMATAYRRKKILGGIFECSPKSLAGVVKAGEDEKSRSKAREEKLHELRMRHANEFNKGIPHQTLQAVAMASSLSPHDLLDLLGADEIRAVAESARASGAVPVTTRKSVDLNSLPPLLNTSRSSPHLPHAPHSPVHVHPPLASASSTHLHLPVLLSPTSPSKSKASRQSPSPFGEEWDKLVALTNSSAASDSMRVPIKSRHKMHRSKTSGVI